jgi:hypothetical protein
MSFTQSTVEKEHDQMVARVYSKVNVLAGIQGEDAVKVALILDDDSDSMVIVHLLLEHLGYHVAVSDEMRVSLRILSGHRQGYVVVVGSTIEALATLTMAAETDELQRHAYILLMDRGESLPPLVQRMVLHSSVLVLRRPLNMALAVRAIEYAEQCIALP